ncbi:MAG: hypothetical protein DCC68_14290 [Planctomycetota bacterium]|nr:MAG: hypothetical protein DCC68_14290 [Planctomycetota bacterium]
MAQSAGNRGDPQAECASRLRYRHYYGIRQTAGNAAKKMAEVHGNRTTAKNAGETGVPIESGAESGALGARTAQFDPDLAAVVDAWPTLPAAIRAGILAMIGTADRDAGAQK